MKTSRTGIETSRRDEAAPIAAAQTQADWLVSRLCELVAIPSVSREEGAIADTVSDMLVAAGLAPRRHGNNVWVEIGDAARPRLLLNSHLDTVPPGAGWSGEPQSPRRIDDRIIGLGANDAKGCVTTMLRATLDCAARLASGERLGGTLVLALTAEEEVSGHGLSEILPRIGPLDAAIVGEPTQLTPMIAQRGLLILRCVARGRSSHPANTPPGAPGNAILNAVADIAKLSEFHWGAPHALLGAPHAHITRIAGGVALNVIPDECEFCIDIRTTPTESHDQLISRLRATLQSDVLVHSQRLVPVETDASAPIVQAALRANPAAAPLGSPAMSDMVFLAGIPSVKIGPGVSARSHTPDEFIRVDELVAGAATYARIIAEYFAHPGVERLP